MEVNDMSSETKTQELSDQSKKIIESIEGMTVLELSHLVKALEDKFGVVAAAPVAVVAQGGAVAADDNDGDDTVNVILASVGDKKIQVLKVVRELTGLGLKEAKDIVDTAPQPIKQGVSKEEAEVIKKQLEEQGAKVEFK
jgi:large subunit ribosomal protein L7/L12